MNESPEEAKARKALEREAKLHQEMLDAALRNIMNREDGRFWMYEHLAACGAMQTPFAQDPHITAFNCGQQNTGLRLIADITRVCPDLWQRMIQERENVNRTSNE